MWIVGFWSDATNAVYDRPLADEAFPDTLKIPLGIHYANS